MGSGHHGGHPFGRLRRDDQRETVRADGKHILAVQGTGGSFGGDIIGADDGGKLCLELADFAVGWPFVRRHHARSLACYTLHA